MSTGSSLLQGGGSPRLVGVVSACPVAHDYKLLEYLSPFEHDWHCKTEWVVHGIDYGQDSSPGERLLRQGHLKGESVHVQIPEDSK